MKGTIIFLNGTSSAGKTTLSHALQELMPEPFQHVALDQFRDGLSDKFRGLNAPAGTPGAEGLNVVPVSTGAGEQFTEIRFGPEGKKVLRGMRRSIRTLAEEGINIIIDDIILSPDFLDDYLKVMSDQTLYFVGVRCPLETIASREALRPGRFPGTAESHFESCHAHGHYDVEVDTSLSTPLDCALQIQARIKAGPPRAFGELYGTS